MVEIVEQEYVEKGIRIHYLESINRDADPIIFLHGMKFQASTWQELGTLREVSAIGYHVMAVDMPGFGKSPASALEQDKVLESFISGQGLHKPVLVGPSMGGRIALEFVLNHQEMVGGLVLVGSVGVEENKDKLENVKVPTLIVWGSEDKISPLVNSEVLHRSIAGSHKVVIDGTPHPCYLEQPDIWHSVLLDFLKK